MDAERAEARLGDAGVGVAPGGYVVEPRPSPAHRAVPRVGGVRPRVALAIALGMGLVALAIAAGGHGPGQGQGQEQAAPSAAAPAPAPVPPAPAASAAPAAVVALTTPERGDLHPTEVRLPTLDVGSTLVDLDVGPDGSLTPPADPDRAGWYVRGAVPGLPGPTVIAGHVDSQAGPAVFYRLDELRAGDRVEVARSDGQVFAYRVATVETHPKADFPTDRVYGPTPGPELRLITCGGEFDRSSRHYTDNVIVTAIPVS